MFIMGDDFKKELTLDEFLDILENDLLDETLEEICEEEKNKADQLNKDDDLEIMDLFDLLEKEMEKIIDLSSSFGNIAIVDNNTLDSIFLNKKKQHSEVEEDEESKLTPEDRKVMRILSRFTN